MTFALKISIIQQVFIDTSSLACSPGNPGERAKGMSFRTNNCYLLSSVENEFLTSSRKYVITQCKIDELLNFVPLTYGTATLFIQD